MTSMRIRRRVIAAVRSIRQSNVHLIQDGQHPGANIYDLHFAKLERKSADDMLLFNVRLTQIKEPGLRKMIEKLFAPVPDL